MYFLNKRHAQNYEYVIKNVYKRALGDPQYHAACYVQTIPEIYEKWSTDTFFRSIPFLWIIKYDENSYWYNDEETGEKYLAHDFIPLLDKEGNEIDSKKYLDLSSSHQKLVDLANKLFSSDNDRFNLSESLCVWDENFLKVYYQAKSIHNSNEGVY